MHLRRGPELRPGRLDRVHHRPGAQGARRLELGDRHRDQPGASSGARASRADHPLAADQRVPVRHHEPYRSGAPAMVPREPGRGPRREPGARARRREAPRARGAGPHARAQGRRRGLRRADGEGLRLSDDLPVMGEGPLPHIKVYGAPRPAVPERVPLTPRFGGCASGAGVGVGADAAHGLGGFRRLPDWLKVSLPGAGEYAETKALLRAQKLHTVCEEARCPNLGHCWSRGTATIMILGDLCTRRCGFCAVAPGRPNGYVDWDEPRRVGEAVAGMNLRHTVITSVARDDLSDGGSTIFAMTIRAIRERSGTVVEVLILDFRGHQDDLQRVIDVVLDVINHNIEMVDRLHSVVRPSARYSRSLELL